MKLFTRLILAMTALMVVSQSHAQTPSLTLCKNATVNYSEFNSGSSIPSVAWEWTFEGGVPTTSTLRKPTVNYPIASSSTSNGLFKTTCISTFSDGSKDTNSVWVLIIDGTLTTIPMRDTVLCSKSISLALDAGNIAFYNHFAWTQDGNILPKDTFSKLSINKGGVYKVTITNICGTANKTVTVKEGVFPVVNLGPDQFVCHNIAIDLIAGVDPTYTYSWVPTLAATPSITASMAGNYKVTVTSPDGCVSTDDINLIDSCPPVLWLPTAFTPNDYAPNDIYKPYLEGYKSMTLRIYNMWGAKLFETSDMNAGWDGTYLSDPCPEGSYVALLEAVGNDTYRRVQYTNFVLVR